MEQIDNFPPRLFVERRGRLVGQNNFWISHQSTGYGDSLFLSTGKMLWQIVYAFELGGQIMRLYCGRNSLP
jgi:hypothetical protein